MGSGDDAGSFLRILRANLESERIAEGVPETYDDARGPEEEGDPPRRLQRARLARERGGEDVGDGVGDGGARAMDPLSDVRRWGGVGAPQARRDRGADVDDEWFVVVEDVEAGVLVVEERAEDRGGEEHDDRLVRERGSLERLASRGGGVVGRGGGERETRGGRRASTSARAPEGASATK